MLCNISFTWYAIELINNETPIIQEKLSNRVYVTCIYKNKTSFRYTHVHLKCVCVLCTSYSIQCSVIESVRSKTLWIEPVFLLYFLLSLAKYSHFLCVNICTEKTHRQFWLSISFLTCDSHVQRGENEYVFGIF